MSKLINKRETQALLGVTDRQVERYVSSGRLSVKRNRDEDGARRNYYVESEVQALKEELNRPEYRSALVLNRQKPTIPTATFPTPDQINAFLTALSKLTERQEQPTEKLFLTVKEAQDFLGISAEALKDAIDFGKVPTFKKLGKGVRIRKKDLEAWARNYSEKSAKAKVALSKIRKK
jgi:excisionase family DNA binding protein